jgi:hypothetical protein
MRDTDKGLGASLFDLQLNYLTFTFFLQRKKNLYSLYIKSELTLSYTRHEIMVLCQLCVLWTFCSKPTSMKYEDSSVGSLAVISYTKNLHAAGPFPKDR